MNHSTVIPNNHLIKLIIGYSFMDWFKIEYYNQDKITRLSLYLSNFMMVSKKWYNHFVINSIQCVPDISISECNCGILKMPFMKQIIDKGHKFIVVRALDRLFDNKLINDILVCSKNIKTIHIGNYNLYLKDIDQFKWQLFEKVENIQITMGIDVMESVYKLFEDGVFKTNLKSIRFLNNLRFINVDISRFGGSNSLNQVVFKGNIKVSGFNSNTMKQIESIKISDCYSLDKKDFLKILKDNEGVGKLKEFELVNLDSDVYYHSKFNIKMKYKSSLKKLKLSMGETGFNLLNKLNFTRLESLKICVLDYNTIETLCTYCKDCFINLKTLKIYQMQNDYDIDIDSNFINLLNGTQLECLSIVGPITILPEAGKLLYKLPKSIKTLSLVGLNVYGLQNYKNFISNHCDNLVSLTLDVNYMELPNECTYDILIDILNQCNNISYLYFPLKTPSKHREYPIDKLKNALDNNQTIKYFGIGSHSFKEINEYINILKRIVIISSIKYSIQHK